VYTKEQLRRWHADTTLGELFDDIDEEGSDGAFLQFREVSMAGASFALIVFRTPITEDDFMHIAVEGARELVRSGRLDFKETHIHVDED